MAGINRIRILIVSEVLTGGGAERFVSTLLNYLDREKFEPIVCLLRNEITYAIPNDLKVLCVGLDRGLSFKQAAIKLANILNEHRIDQVLTNIPYTMRFVAEAFRINERTVSWIARIGNNPAIRYKGLKQWIINYKFRRDGRFVQEFVCNAKSMRKALIQSYPATKNKISVLANPTDFDLIDNQAEICNQEMQGGDGKAILFVGRLHQVKRIPDLLIAFSNLNDSSLQLWICGEGTENKNLSILAKKLNISEQIKWFGFVNNPYYMMKVADLFVLTSESEGLPNSLIEAQGLGMPAVSTDCPYGPEEIVENGITGFLVPVGDVNAISASMAKIINSGRLRSSMAEQAKKLTRDKYSVEILMPKWNEFLYDTYMNFKKPLEK